MPYIVIGPRVRLANGDITTAINDDADCFEVYVSGSNDTIAIYDSVSEARAVAKAIAEFENVAFHDYARQYI